jgi:uncharacterized membrane protein
METTADTISKRWPDIVVNKIELTDPFVWLKKGWKDMRNAGKYSLMYGLGIVVISGSLTFALFVTDNLFLLPFLVAAFFLIAPFLGIGLYEMSAQLERGESLKNCNTLQIWKNQHSQISIITVGFLIIAQLWIASNYILFALLYKGISPPIDNFISSVFLTEKGMNFSIASITVCFFFAFCAYVITVITVPILIDRKIDGFTAIRISIKSVLKNMLAMMLWAFLIVLIVGIGLITYHIGLIIALPVIGHGSWHAYRSLVPSST